MPRSMESASRHRRNDVQGPDRARAAGARHRPQHGLLQIFKVASVNPQWNGDSWLLTGTLGTTATQAIGGVVWTAAIIGFAALAGSVVGWLPAAWFQPLAIGSSVVSLAGLLLFPVAFPTFSTIGAVAVDVAVLAATVWYGWQPEGSGA